MSQDPPAVGSAGGVEDAAIDPSLWSARTSDGLGSDGRCHGGRGRDGHGRDGRGRDATAAIGELRAVMSAIDAGVLTLDTEGRVHSQNDPAYRIFGGPLRDVADVLGPFSRPRFERPGMSLDGTSAWQHERTELQLRSRPDRWLEMTRHIDVRGDYEAIVVRDVTDARRSRGLREAFLGMLSHELRTPVTSIYAAADLLRGHRRPLSEDVRDDLAQDIAAEAERLLRLVDDLMVLAYFEEGLQLISEPSLLQRVVPVVVDRERRRWPAIDIDLRIGPDLPVVIGDETSVQQVVRNLISNAAKYGGGTRVVVELSAADGGDGAIVRVLDGGAGISPHEAEAIFLPFYRSARTRDVSAGAGVGLYVCRRLIDTMGGHMWARPREDGGSEFGFWLPEYAHDSDEMSAALDGVGYRGAVGTTVAST
jgi:signal transduction histidine kinase